MATTLVSNIAVFASSSGTGNQSHLVYAPVQQRWWLFYIDSKTATTVKTLVSSSSDLTTATWSAAATSSAFPNSHALTSNDQCNLAVCMIPNSINSNDAVHVAVSIGPSAAGVSGQNEHIRAKFTSTSSITWETWSEFSANAPAGNWDSVKGTALGVSTTGIIHEASLTLDNNMDAAARIASNADTGSTWTNAFGSVAITDSSMSFECNVYGFATLASGAMVIVADNGVGTEPHSTGMRYNKYTSGASWPTTGSASTGNGTTSQDQNDWCLCAVDTIHVYAFRRTSTAVDCRMYSGSAWSTPTSTIPSETTKAASGLFAATDGTDLYLFAIDSTGNGAIKYVKGSTANGTISFDGSWTTLEAAGSTARNFISGHPSVGNNQIGVIYTAVNGSNFDLALSVLNFNTSSFSAKQSSYLMVHV